ncbi:MAG: 50S ribosomal protein L6 [Planctomycetes bacterium]|nr:50S ribosomal protein L6 [Planctomycetota bacterium]
MSRIGKQPVAIPAGIKVSQVKEGHFTRLDVEGPKGKVSFPFRAEVGISIESGVIRVTRAGDEAFTRAYHGTARALIANMVKGAAQGFEKRLEIEGVGYQAKTDGKKLTVQIGFCHPVELKIPAGLTIETPKPTTVVVKGADRQLVGEFAAQVRGIRPAEPYKGKGVRYSDEKIIRKAGKAFGSGE